MPMHRGEEQRAAIEAKASSLIGQSIPQLYFSRDLFNFIEPSISLRQLMEEIAGVSCCY